MLFRSPTRPIWSNLMLHWLDDPLPALRELHRVLDVGGLLCFATLGPDTLKELRAAAAKVGAGDTAKRFLDMHDLGDMLVAVGFGDPVMDMELITLTYPTPRAFLADQRHLGGDREQRADEHREHEDEQQQVVDQEGAFAGPQRLAVGVRGEGVLAHGEHDDGGHQAEAEEGEEGRSDRRRG